MPDYEGIEQEIWELEILIDDMAEEIQQLRNSLALFPLPS